MSTPNLITVQVEHQPSPERLQQLGVEIWPIWTKEVSEFPWTSEQIETCDLLTGDAIVTPDQGEPVQITSGDLVTFPAEMSCIWKILTDVKKHYYFGKL